MTIDATKQTWNYKGVEYELCAFDRKPVITLPNGTKHQFRMWDEVTERKREDLLKSVIVTSAAVVNGENPRDVKTDFTRSAIAYYDMMIERVGGMIVDGAEADPAGFYNVHAPLGADETLLQRIPATMKKAAAARLYGGDIQMERENDDTPIDFDPFAAIEQVGLQEEIERQQATQEIYRLSAERLFVIKQELGAEILKSGQRTPPKHVLRYTFDEPLSTHFSKWEMKGSKGFAISLPKGGTRAESYYNLETLKQLFDDLVVSIEGASLNGAPIELPSDRTSEHRKALLAQVPLSIKKMTVATLFQEMSSLGNY